MPHPPNSSMVIPRCSVNVALWIYTILGKGEKPSQLGRITVSELDVGRGTGSYHGGLIESVELEGLVDLDKILVDFKWEGICFRILDTNFRFCLRDTPSLLAHEF
jgi:hypothetical protein